MSLTDDFSDLNSITFGPLAACSLVEVKLLVDLLGRTVALL